MHTQAAHVSGVSSLAGRRRLPVSGVLFAEGCRCRIGEKGLLGVGSVVLEYGLLFTARCSGRGGGGGGMGEGRHNQRNKEEIVGS